jgi:hypothetical protein
MLTTGSIDPLVKKKSFLTDVTNHGSPPKFFSPVLSNRRLKIFSANGHRSTWCFYIPSIINIDLIDVFWPSMPAYGLIDEGRRGGESHLFLGSSHTCFPFFLSHSPPQRMHNTNPSFGGYFHISFSRTILNVVFFSCEADLFGGSGRGGGIAWVFGFLMVQLALEL